MYVYESGSIQFFMVNTKFDHKLRCYKQCFWKNCHHSCIIEIKMKISHDQGRNDIGVVIATI